MREQAPRQARPVLAARRCCTGTRRRRPSSACGTASSNSSQVVGAFTLGLRQMLLVVDEGIEARRNRAGRQLAVGQRHRGLADLEQPGLDRIDRPAALRGRAPSRRRASGRCGPPREYIMSMCWPPISLVSTTGVVVAGHQLVGDVLVVEFLEDVDVLFGDLRLVLPADERDRGRGGRPRRPPEGGSRSHRSHSLQHTTTRYEKISKPAFHGRISLSSW